MIVFFMSSIIYYGSWFGSFLFVSEERLNEYRSWRSTIDVVLRSDLWDEVFKSFSIEELESTIGSALDTAWRSENIEHEGEREAGELPAISSLEVGVLAEFGGLDFLDADVDLDLPEEIAELAYYPEVSPMTGYEPRLWREDDLLTVREIACGLGYTLIDASELFELLSQPL